jgi:hypothetical protein
MIEILYKKNVVLLQWCVVFIDFDDFAKSFEIQ